MTRAFKTILATCLIALPTLSNAQEAATETAPQTQAGGDHSTGVPVLLGLPNKDEAAVGEEYLLDVSGDWQIRCAKTDTAKDPCQIYQLLLNAEGPLAEISIFPIVEFGNDARAGATLITPLDTMLPPGILISVDGANARRYPFSWCSTVGCVGRIGLLDEDILAYKNGSAATVQIVPAVAPDQTVTATISLKGFTLGYDKLVALHSAE